MLSQTLQDKIRDMLVTVATSVFSRQSAYFNQQIGNDENGNPILRNHFWQGRITSSIPVDGTEIAPIKTVRVPPHPSWAGLSVTLPVTAPVAFECHEYDGPDGKGWALIVWIIWQGNKWRRTQNFGPEVWRTTGWVQVD